MIVYLLKRGRKKYLPGVGWGGGNKGVGPVFSDRNT